MAKSTSRYFCKECGYESAKWLGQCPSCRAWNTFVEEPVAKAAPASGFSRNTGTRPPRQRPVRVDEIALEKEDRIPTGFQELDRVLGGGIVVGSMVLLGGDPGIGKSTILLEVSRNLATEDGKSVLYVSGEESLKQIKLRAERIRPISGDLRFMTETNIENIIETIREEKPDFVVIDSIQTMYTESVTAAPGSVSQVRESAAQLLRTAKECGIAIFLVGHVTKDGTVAGPKILEHMVDVVLFFEGESGSSLRILHGQKNRFGSTNEIGVFEMTDKGLREVPNPSEAMLASRPKNVSGNCAACVMEGTRPLITEIQALTTQTAYPTAKRTSDGIDYNRMFLLIAVLEKRMGLKLAAMDIYLNVIGGLHLTETAADVAVALAIYSSLKDKPVPDDLIAFGEIGLAGEVRAVSGIDGRVSEAVRLGFRKIVLPAKCAAKLDVHTGDAQIIPIRSVFELTSLI